MGDPEWAAIPTKGFSLGEIFVGFVNFAKHSCHFSEKIFVEILNCYTSNNFY